MICVSITIYKGLIDDRIPSLNKPYVSISLLESLHCYVVYKSRTYLVRLFPILVFLSECVALL